MGSVHRTEGVPALLLVMGPACIGAGVCLAVVLGALPAVPVLPAAAGAALLGASLLSARGLARLPDRIRADRERIAAQRQAAAMETERDLESALKREELKRNLDASVRARLSAGRLGEGWTEYRWNNPLTGTVQDKLTYVKAVPGTDLVVYVGIYI